MRARQGGPTPECLRRRLTSALGGAWAGPSHFLDSGAAAGAAREPMGHTVPCPTAACVRACVRACTHAEMLTRRAAGPRGQVLKRRLLAAAGVVCVSVPFWEWNALKGEASEQWAYLRRKLAEARAGESAGEMTAAVGHLET